MKYTANKIYEQIRNILQTSYMDRYDIYYKQVIWTDMKYTTNKLYGLI